MNIKAEMFLETMGIVESLQAGLMVCLTTLQCLFFWHRSRDFMTHHIRRSNTRMFFLKDNHRFLMKPTVQQNIDLNDITLQKDNWDFFLFGGIYSYRNECTQGYGTVSLIRK